jgi:glycosyltransferase involved in cell wall biosynthesis
VVIPNGIRPLRVSQHDPHIFARNFGIAPSRPVVVAAGRLAPVKGYAGLIRAWQGIDADLVIAGEGPQRAELEALIRQLDLAQSVHLAGFRSDAPSLMVHADMVVISSEREGFPYAMVEALHLEKVIVSTHFPGAEDHLPSSFLVPFGDERRLRDLIKSSLTNPDVAAAEYAPIWRRARTELTVERMIERTIRAYHLSQSQAA